MQMETETTPQFLAKLSNVKFRQNPSNDSLVASCVQRQAWTQRTGAPNFVWVIPANMTREYDFGVLQAVGIATGYRLDDRGVKSSSPGGGKNFHFSTSSRPALWSTQWVPGPLSPGVRRPGREGDRPLTFN
jgi:hypothetical protein